MKKLFLIAAIVMATVSCSSSKDWKSLWNVAPAQNFNNADMDAHFKAHEDMWKAVFEFLNTRDLAALPAGRYEIVEGQAFANVSEYVPKAAEDCRFEAHDKYIDLQYVVSGSELIGVVRNDTIPATQAYDEGADIAFFGTQIEGAQYETADSSRYFVFFPADKHRPSMALAEDGKPVKKVVVKILF